MSNLTDALIAAKLVGGSGGSGGGSGLPDASGQADNTALSVQNGAWAASGAVLPPIETSETTLFAEQSVEFTEYEGVYEAWSTGITPVIGETYTVSWDGTDYTCTAFEFTGVPAIGNASLHGGTDTGEPFLIQFGGIFTLSTAASHTVKVFTVSQTPVDGSVLIAAGGQWRTQAGYGYNYFERTVVIPATDYMFSADTDYEGVIDSSYWSVFCADNVGKTFRIESADTVTVDTLKSETSSRGVTYYFIGADNYSDAEFRPATGFIAFAHDGGINNPNITEAVFRSATNGTLNITLITGSVVSDVIDNSLIEFAPKQYALSAPSITIASGQAVALSCSSGTSSADGIYAVLGAVVSDSGAFLTPLSFADYSTGNGWVIPVINHSPTDVVLTEGASLTMYAMYLAASA